MSRLAADQRPGCAQCGAAIANLRRGARYCSPGCKQRAWRERRVTDTDLGVTDVRRKLELAQSEHGPIPDIGRLMPERRLLAELGRYFAKHDDPWLWWLAGAIVCALLPDRGVEGSFALVKNYREHGLRAENLRVIAAELGLVAHQVEGSHGRG